MTATPHVAPQRTYWEARCSGCGHARKWHGEGGCNHDPTFAQVLLGHRAKRCGCPRRQGAIGD